MKFRLRKCVPVLFLIFLFACGREEAGVPRNISVGTDGVNVEGGDESMEALVKPVSSPAGAIALARGNARKLMQAASQRTSSGEASAIFRKMEAALGRAKIKTPKPGHDLKACIQDPMVLAFVMLKSPNTIHVCARALAADPKELAQVLTHETAHVVGVHDECGATQLEVAVMRLSGVDLSFRNGYMNRCGIR